MSQTPVRFAILGFGHHAVRRLVPAFARSKDALLAGMWRRDQIAAAENCSAHHIAHCFASREELCASPEIDAVFITSPDAMHLDDALLAMRHGNAVLCEKPLAMNVSEASAMAQAAKAAGVVFGVAQNFRYNRSVNYLREQVAAGLIGQPSLHRPISAMRLRTLRASGSRTRRLPVVVLSRMSACIASTRCGTS